MKPIQGSRTDTGICAQTELETGLFQTNTSLKLNLNDKLWKSLLLMTRNNLVFDGRHCLGVLHVSLGLSHPHATARSTQKHNSHIEDFQRLAIKDQEKFLTLIDLECSEEDERSTWTQKIIDKSEK